MFGLFRKNKNKEEQTETARSASTNQTKSKVAITGKLLKMERSDAAALINNLENADFVKSVTYETNYLVATKFDTAKAKKAAKMGIAVISETELFSYIEEGAFPHSEKPEKPKRQWNGDDLAWVKLDSNRFVLLDYVDADGVLTEQRIVQLTQEAVGSTGLEYFGGMVGFSFRTFRKDRIVSISDV
ncbi:MAG: hypothetical protein HOC33_19920 [Alphaproteobacteria bacterium]|jgi:hypothetical protein|nr:hypothetical protein [Alphaproteobacteria bacterium]